MTMSAPGVGRLVAWRALISLVMVAFFTVYRAATVRGADMINVVVNPSTNMSEPIPPNFASFSIEVFGAQWWTAVYPKPTRPSFVNLIRQLDEYTHGPRAPIHRRIFRIGGNSADTSVYNPTNLTLPQSLGEITYNITDADILSLDQAMAAVNGQLIVGLNFRLPFDPSWALRHVQAIDRQVGWKNVLALEIGNEVSFYPGYARGRGWNFNNYSAEFDVYVSAFYAQVASLPKPFLQGLACGGSDWLGNYSTFVDQHPGLLTTVSHHFYPESHNNAANTSTAKLHKLVADRDAAEESAAINATVHQLHRQHPEVPFVIGEGNSVSGHGQLNVSTTFGACLWAVHEMMNDISVGVYTWQFHNNVLEDFTLSSYTAFIFQDLDSDVPTVMPLYYAMRFVTEATRNFAVMVDLQQKTTNPLIKVFAFREARGDRAELRVVVLHKDYNATTPASITISLDKQQPQPATAHYIVLTAASISSNFGLFYAGQTYDNSRDGLPTGQFVTTEVQPDSGGQYVLSVQPTSAVLLTIPLADSLLDGKWAVAE